jgi:hypothetical protein
VAVGDGFSAGLVADGTGGGGVSGTMLRVGSGKGVALLLLVFLLAFAFSFAGAGLKSSSGSTETSGLATGLAFTFAGGVIVPPDGIPCSPFPVGDCDGCTG